MPQTHSAPSQNSASYFNRSVVETPLGRPVAQAFSANGSPTATLKYVKSTIKEGKAAKLGGTSADKLAHCKVSGNVSNTAVNEIVPFENKNSSSEVPESTTKFSGFLNTGSRKAIHVVVERSPSERSIKPLEAFDPAPSAPTCTPGRSFFNNCRKLYLSHLLTSWVDRSFEFASYLLISKVYIASLLQASAYGLATTLLALLLSNRIGNWINISRLNTYRITLLTQKASIVISTLFFHFLDNNKNSPNSTVTSTFVEYTLISQIHRDVPPLADRAPYQSSSSTPNSSPSGEQEEQGEEETNNNTASAVSFREYMRHRTFLITLSLGRLYVNVLSFGTMTSYLVLIGYSSGLLGIMKAVAGIVSVAGTFAQPLLARRLGNMLAGLWSVWQ
ncbi:hypothetical protein BGX24_003017 [Mortierella sp. AD032]|nr:hypothetical protein BGX24_003017 [Mortierella sp. AD032]